ncbi:DUF1659 domain-containing protein [Alkalicoccobacillus gibsonii]|jgi:hypothetical protein|uniref:DUF1659 domain-containing protein n=1 Tax=Alkalicoccobacillus gibsonii TaxID=79881 RepID=A0ABU9VH00_9BACI
MNQRTRLTLQFVIGRGNDGKDLLATKSFQNIDGEASDAAITTTAHALISLQQYQIFSVARQNTYSLD